MPLQAAFASANDEKLEKNYEEHEAYYRKSVGLSLFSCPDICCRISFVCGHFYLVTQLAPEILLHGSGKYLPTAGEKSKP